MKFPKIRNPLDYVYPEKETVRRYLRFCDRHPLAILTIIFVVTVISVIGTLHLYRHVDTGLTALLPSHYLSVRTLNKIDQEGSKLSEQIFVEGENTDELVAYAHEIQAILEKDPYIFYVKIKRDMLPKENALLVFNQDRLLNIRDRVKKKVAQTKLKKSGFFLSFEDEEPSAQRDKDLSLADIREEFPSVLGKKGTYDEYFLSKDRKVIQIQVFPKNPPSNFGFAEKVCEVMESYVVQLQAKYPTLKASFYGPYHKRLDEFKLVQRDIKLIGSLTMIAVILCVVLYFRQILPVVVIIIPLALGLVWTMGLTDLLIGKLNTITAFLVGILTGLGVDFCIYLYSRYLEDRRNGKAHEEALVHAVHHTGRAAFTSGLNTALVFLSLMLADFKGFSEFGLIAGMGLIICYLAIYLLLPAFITWFVRLGLLKTEENKTFFGIPWPNLPKLIPKSMRRYPFSGTILAFTVGCVLIFIVIFPKLEFEYDFGKLRSDMITYTHQEALLERFNFGPPLGNAALLTMNSMEDIPAVEKAVQKKIAEDTSTPTLRGFSSIHTAWPTPEEQQKRMVIIAEIRELVQDVKKHLKGKDKDDAKNLLSFLNVKPYPLEDVAKDIVTNYSPRNGPVGSYGYVLARYEIRTKDGRDAMKFAEDVRQIETERGTFYASSQEVVFADILGLMLHESRLTVLLAILLITVFVWLDFWSVPKSLLVLVPVTVGTMLTLVLLYSFGGKVTFYNMIVFPMIIGMGEDNAVHLYHRYHSEGRGSICKVMKTTGVATWMASVTNILGFVGLAFSHHKGLQSIGLLAAVGLLSCLICSLLVLPALVQFLEDILPDFPSQFREAK